MSAQGVERAARGLNGGSIKFTISRPPRATAFVAAHFRAPACELKQAPWARQSSEKLAIEMEAIIYVTQEAASGSMVVCGGQRTLERGDISLRRR